MEKKNATANSEVNVTKKQLRDATTGIAATANSDNKKAKEERRGLNQTLAFLKNAQNDETKAIAKFLGITPKSNKDQLRKIATYIRKNAPYVANFCYVGKREGLTRETVKASYNTPCTSKGNEILDYLDVIRDIRKIKEVTTAKRNVIARAKMQCRRLHIEKNTWDYDAICRVQNSYTAKEEYIPKPKQIHLGLVSITDDMIDGKKYKIIS